MWRMRTINVPFGLWVATFVLFGQGTNEHTINTYYGCDYQLECGDNNGDGVWYHNNRSISNTTLKSVGFDDAGRYQCKNPSNEVYDDLTLHVYGLQGVSPLNCNSISNNVCARNVIRGQPVTLCVAFTTFPSSVSETYTSNLLGIKDSRWEVSSYPLSHCGSEDDCQKDPAYRFNDSLEWLPCLTVANVTEDLSFSYAIRTYDVAGDVCQAPSGVVQSKAEFSVHVLDTPTNETTPSSSHPSTVESIPIITPSPVPGGGTINVAAIVAPILIVTLLVVMVLFILVACMICRTRSGRDCSSVEDDKDNILDLETEKKSSSSSFGPVINVVPESVMAQLNIGSTEEGAGYGNTALDQSTPADGAITEQSLASMGTSTIPLLTSSQPCERSQMVRPDSLWIKGEGKVDSGVSVWTSPSNSMSGPGLESSPSGGLVLESSPSGGPELDSNISNKPLIPGDGDDVSEKDFREGFYTNVPKT